MRVIAGTARSLPLKTIETQGTRPTTDRVKETLFNMLHPYIPGCRFLDLFAGSGAIGIEALSRGASEAVFVENNESALDCIRHNLSFTHLADRAEVMPGDVLTVIRRLDRLEVPPFDIIFMDPPYRMEWENRVLAVLNETGLVSEDTLILVEAARETDFAWLAEAGYYIRREKVYKTNKHMWLGKERE